MKKILIYHGKHGDITYDASTKAKEALALKKIFKFLDSKDWDAYFELKDKPEPLPTSKPCEFCKGKGTTPPSGQERMDYDELVKQHALYKKAKKGDLKAIDDLLSARENYEYEGWSIETVV